MPAAGAPFQRLFASPEEGLKSLADAVKAKDQAALDQIFGPSGKDLRSGDSVQDAAEFEELAKHLAEKTSLMKEGDAKVILSIGNENWPFPIPLVKKDNQWFFDTEAGKEEILNRRIGENELTAILISRAYVKAQREYVLKDWDGERDIFPMRRNSGAIPARETVSSGDTSKEKRSAPWVNSWRGPGIRDTRKKARPSKERSRRLCTATISRY